VTLVATEPAIHKEHTRRDELLQVAAHAFAERGFATTTTRDIAVEAKILSGSLYHHFDSKESMVDEILRPYFVALDELVKETARLKAPAADKVARLIRETHQLSVRHQYAAIIYSHDGVVLRPLFPYIEQTLERIERLWLRTLRSGIRDGSFARDLDPSVVYRTIIGATSYATQWFQREGPMTIDQIADIQMRFFLDGLSSR
jgi:TetR/AcrR family transcriptional regulator, cholesterol catabolism regulator